MANKASASTRYMEDGDAVVPVGAATPLNPHKSKLARDLEFGEQDFQRIRELIYQRAGIVIASHKRDMVYSRVGRRLRHHNLLRFADYLAQLEKNPTTSEWDAFTNSLTTNLTSFFREPHHFPILAQHVTQRRGPVRVWCAAASTGEEPYSIAMQLVEALGENADIRVLATDIDTHALKIAKRGIYTLKQIECLDAKRRRRFFQKGSGERTGHVRVRPSLAQRVTFEPLNLVSSHWQVKGSFDAIFCRNVMIYFDTTTQASILKHFVHHIKQDGLLFAGHSESFTYLCDQFRLRGQTVYTLGHG